MQRFAEAKRQRSRAFLCASEAIWKLPDTTQRPRDAEARRGSTPTIQGFSLRFSLRLCVSASRLRIFKWTLSLNYHKAHVYPVRTGIPFLGFRVYPTYRRLRADNVRLARRRLQRQHALVLAGRLSHARLQESLRAWIAHASHADTWRLRRRLLAKLVFSRAAR